MFQQLGRGGYIRAVQTRLAIVSLDWFQSHFTRLISISFFEYSTDTISESWNSRVFREIFGIVHAQVLNLFVLISAIYFLLASLVDLGEEDLEDPLLQTLALIKLTDLSLQFAGGLFLVFVVQLLEIKIIV